MWCPYSEDGHSSAVPLRQEEEDGGPRNGGKAREKARAEAVAGPALHTERVCSQLTVAMLKTSQDPSLRSG